MNEFSLKKNNSKYDCQIDEKEMKIVLSSKNPNNEC